MINSISSFVNSIFGAQYINSVQKKQTSNNPFGGSIPTTTYIPKNYAKNKPIPGGYFRGYHNGKPNIVGSRLLVEI